MRRLALLLLAACGSSSPAVDGGADAGDSGVIAGGACPASSEGYGSCSSDTLALLTCRDGGWSGFSCAASNPPRCTTFGSSIACGCTRADAPCHAAIGETQCSGNYCKADEYCFDAGGFGPECRQRDGGPACISYRDGGGCSTDFDCEPACTCAAGGCFR